MRRAGAGFASPSPGALRAGRGFGQPGPGAGSVLRAGPERDGLSGPFRPKSLRESVQRPQRYRWTRDSGGGRAASWARSAAGPGRRAEHIEVKVAPPAFAQGQPQRQ